MKTTLSLLLIVTCTLASNMVSAHPSWGIVVDKNRDIYFADIMHHDRGSVWKLSHDGELELLFKDFHAHNVSLDRNFNLVTAYGEMDTHYMVRLNSDGSIDTLSYANDYTLFNGGCCTYSSKGEIIFNANHFLWRLTKKGEKEKISDHHFEWTQTVYADDEGNYYAPDIGDGKGKLIRIDSNGVAQIIARNLITKSSKPYDKHADVLMGITKGCDGHMYIAELAGKRIIRIVNDSTVETFYTSSGGWVPTGIDFFSGDAYILEYNGQEGPRIIKVDESGNKTQLFNYDDHHNEPARPSQHPTQEKRWN